MFDPVRHMIEEAVACSELCMRLKHEGFLLVRVEGSPQDVDGAMTILGLIHMIENHGLHKLLS